MAFSNSTGGPQQQFQHAEFAGLQSSGRPSSANTNRIDDMQFDIFEWYPHHQSCQRYFLDHAQHSAPVQAVAAFINIGLPYQKQPVPVLSFALGTPSGYPDHGTGGSGSGSGSVGTGAPTHRAGMPSPSASVSNNTAQFHHVSLISYLRRLVITGLDLPGVLHGFFGDDWVKGVGPLHEQERRNYLFAAKSGGWAAVKKDYDILPLETVPFLRPLRAPTDGEILAAEKSWSEWLAMEDWMVGPRAPDQMDAAPQNLGRRRGSNNRRHG